MQNDAGIHPAPSEFSLEQLTADPVLQFFHYAHLPPKLQETSKDFFYMAERIVMRLPRNVERTVALRKLLEAKDAAVRAKLLEAKDAAVRANLPAPSFGQRERSATGPELGEPVEIGGHDEDRDGPVDFNG